MESFIFRTTQTGLILTTLCRLADCSCSCVRKCCLIIPVCGRFGETVDERDVVSTEPQKHLDENKLNPRAESCLHKIKTYSTSAALQLQFCCSGGWRPRFANVNDGNHAVHAWSLGQGELLLHQVRRGRHYEVRRDQKTHHLFIGIDPFEFDRTT